MRNEELKKFGNQKLPEDIVPVRFDLRHKDVMLSANLVKAASGHQWDEVTSLLKQGADPRICRYSDGICCESALYFALKEKQYKLAEDLFDAGDRLDDLHISEFDTVIPADVLGFLTHEAACGCNYFMEEDKPLSECIRCGLWSQIEGKMKAAPLEELNLSVEMIGVYLRNWNASAYLQVLQDLQKHGAEIARFRDELLEEWERFRKMPVVFRPDESLFRQMVDLLCRACHKT